MTLEQFVGFILILLMMGIVYFATAFISGARCNGHGFWHIVVRSVFYSDYRYSNWLRNNTIYVYSSGLVLCLCITILTLIAPFSKGHMFVRPEVALYCSIPLYFCLLKICQFFMKRI